jgi:hypothetical protein
LTFRPLLFRNHDSQIVSRRGLATLSWIPFVLSRGTVVLAAVALIISHVPR